MIYTGSFDRSVIFHTPLKSCRKCSRKLIITESQFNFAKGSLCRYLQLPHIRCTGSFDRSVIFPTPIKSCQKCSLRLILAEKSSLVYDI